jgi:hypothetical protein
MLVHWTHIPHECILAGFLFPRHTPATIRVWRKLHFCYQDTRNECRKHPQKDFKPSPKTKNPRPKR